MTEALASTDHPISPDGPRRPALLVFDVNETLSDMAPLATRFEDVGVPPEVAQLWFTEVLRDGFALTAAGTTEAFATLAAEGLRVRLHGEALERPLEDAVDHVMQGLGALGVHADVPPGIDELTGLGIRLVTLSNGGTSVAETLLEAVGVREHFERLLSVEGAGVWKPAIGAYAYALGECGVDPMDAMLVAVHPWDIDGAARAGLATAWVRRAGARYPSYFTPPDLEVASLTELAAVLR